MEEWYMRVRKRPALKPTGITTEHRLAQEDIGNMKGNGDAIPFLSASCGVYFSCKSYFTKTSNSIMRRNPRTKLNVPIGKGSFLCASGISSSKDT